MSVSYLNLRRLHAHNNLVDHTHQALIELKLLENAVLDAESGMRGFLVAADETYLKPLEQANVDARDSLSRLRRLIADSPAQQQRLNDLEASVHERIGLIQQFVEVSRRDGPDGGRALIARDAGKAAMDALRSQNRALERAEERLLASREAGANVAYWTAVVSSVISGALGLALAAFCFVLAQRELAARAQEAEDLEHAKELLEERVRERTAAISEANQELREQISEREQAERKVRLFADELQRSNRELEQFAAVASHDLQEPLRKIQAFGDRLQNHCRGALGDKGREYLDRMLVSAGRMRTLIDGLLQFSRVSTRQQPAIAVDLGQVARDVVADLEGRLHQTHGTVEVNGLPTIAADPLQMRQLFQNLLGNALKFQRPGVPPHVRISGRVLPGPPVSAEETQLGLQCELTIEDNGVGFDPAYTDRIFELFQRLHGRDEYEGTGMGLAICKKIVERHGGKITASSKPGEGSRFLVTLPVLSTPPPLSE
jgi:signal transduction histidine kinase